MNRDNVESIYPLLPNQEAFWMAHQHAHVDPGCLQANYRIVGELEFALFKEALSATQQQHQMLRATIQPRPDKSPLIVVWKNVESDLQFTDLSDLEQTHQRKHIDAWQAVDFQQGVDLTQSLPHRFMLFKLSANRHELVWTFHHLFLDGWSNSLAIRDWFGHFESFSKGDSKPLPHSRYGEYLALQKKRSPSASKTFWQKYYAGFSGTPRQFRASTNYGGIKTEWESVSNSLERPIATQLSQLLKKKQLTANSAAAAIWSLTLADLYQQNDVAFGATVSGRAIPMAGIQEMVGLFSNIVPMRQQINNETTMRNWLLAIRNEQFEIQPHEQTQLFEIENTCMLPRGRVLAETVLVVENFPVFHRDNQLRVEKFHSGLATGFPLTVCVLPDEGWSVKCIFDLNSIDTLTATTVLTRFCDSLAKLITGMEQTVGAFRSQLLPTGQFPMNTELCEHQSTQPEPQEEFVGTVGVTAPKNDTELKLLMIWEQVIGRVDIDVDDRFFDIGGRSLTAVRLIRRINTEFGTNFSPAILIESPTIASFARLLADDQSHLKSNTIIRFNNCQSGSPLICVHAGEIEAMYFRFLATHFPDRPVFALQSKGLDGKTKPLDSVEAIASDHLAELSAALQPSLAKVENPDFLTFDLIGYCMGCQVAFEIARQIEISGGKIGVLTIVDTSLKNRMKKIPMFNIWPEGKSFLWWFPRFVAKRMFGERTFYSAKRQKERLLDAIWSLNSRLNFSSERRDYWTRRIVRKASKKAYHEYEPAVIQSRICLIRSSESEHNPKKDFHVALKNHTAEGKFSVATVEGEHRKILLEPAVQQVAHIVRRLTSRE